MILYVKNSANFTFKNLKYLLYLRLNTHTHTHTQNPPAYSNLFLFQFGGFAKMILSIYPRLKSFRRGSINKSETYGRNKPKRLKIEVGKNSKIKKK